MEKTYSITITVTETNFWALRVLETACEDKAQYYKSVADSIDINIYPDRKHQVETYNYRHDVFNDIADQIHDERRIYKD